MGEETIIWTDGYGTYIAANGTCGAVAWIAQDTGVKGEDFCILIEECDIVAIQRPDVASVERLTIER